MKGSSTLYEEMLERKAELRKKLFPNLIKTEVQESTKCSKKLICELAKAVKAHFMSVPAVNAILEVLIPYHPGLPSTVDKLLNTAEILKNTITSEDSGSEAEYNDLDVPDQIHHEIFKGQKRLQTGIITLKSQLTLGLAEIKSLLEEIAGENRVQVCKSEDQFIDKDDMKRIKLPLENGDDLERLEAQLKLVDGAAAEMQIYLNQLPVKAQFGNYATTMLRDLISPDFILECRWASKMELKNTALMQLIVAKVMEEFPSIDEARIKDHIGQFLRKNAMLVAKTHRQQQNIDSEEDESNSFDCEFISVKNETVTVNEVSQSRKRPREDDDEDDEEAVEYFNEEHLETDELEGSSSNVSRPTQGFVVRAQAIPRSNSVELPICSIAELENLETTLKHVEDAPSEFMDQLGFVIKHSTIGKYIGKICRSVFEEDFLLSCRWFGMKSDQVTLKHTICMRLIISKVKQEFPEIDERKIMDTLAQFFRSWGCHSVKAKTTKMENSKQMKK